MQKVYHFPFSSSSPNEADCITDPFIGSTPTVFSEPISVLTQTPLLESAGASYKPPVAPPKIAREQAITATQHLGMVSEDSQPEALSYVLMSYSDPADYKGELAQAGILDKYPHGFRNIPVWVFTFRGLHMEGSYNPNPVNTPTSDTPWSINHEMNVVISADSGKYLEAFTYR